MTKLQRLAVTPAQISPPYILLSAEQQHYLRRVLRLGVGDRFIAMDGYRHWWLSQLEPPTGSGQTARILEPILVQTELPARITLIAALPKGNGFDEVVRQTTELGVMTILPMMSDRTLLQPSSQKLDRWQRIAQEAAEQSERLVIPIITEPLPFSGALATTSTRIEAQNQRTRHGEPCYICVTEQSVPHLLHCLETSGDTTPQSLSLMTGPEGGWTEAELEQAIAAGFQPVSLGRRILRAVTAPSVALALIAATLERNELD